MGLDPVSKSTHWEIHPKITNAIHAQSCGSKYQGFIPVGHVMVRLAEKLNCLIDRIGRDQTTNFSQPYTPLPLTPGELVVQSKGISKTFVLARKDSKTDAFGEKIREITQILPRTGGFVLQGQPRALVANYCLMFMGESNIRRSDHFYFECSMNVIASPLFSPFVGVIAHVMRNAIDVNRWYILSWSK